VNRNRQIDIEHIHVIEKQRDARREAEEQLNVLIESSPAAIITADSNGCILMANEAAHRMLALESDLKIVITPALRDEGIECTWILEPGLPPVWADQTNLIQVFLNLTTNSRRALSPKKDKMLSVSARSEGHRVLVEFTDNGGGVDTPERLFHPFQAGAQQSGLGLYLSRAFMRSFGGELRYKALPGRACFIVELSQVSQLEKAS
jgi:C4-dicarboxylate-specific signal transduction histidine kinase